MKLENSHKNKNLVQGQSLDGFIYPIYRPKIRLMNHPEWIVERYLYVQKLNSVRHFKITRLKLLDK